MQAPTGFWDPAGFTADGSVENFKRRRQTELKHGRISMLATMGYITPEIFVRQEESVEVCLSVCLLLFVRHGSACFAWFDFAWLVLLCFTVFSLYCAFPYFASLLFLAFVWLCMSWQQSML